ncbi:hypothetical protein K438DRAFT_2025577 [Mycena galopus ATCC 62051]|nr:hypothetical protein K438DRAFT_2025577 [Mycena galopus ATCC 62051]
MLQIVLLGPLSNHLPDSPQLSVNAYPPRQPACGALSSDNFTEFNVGNNLNGIKKVVIFGDSWTSTDTNGTVSLPPKAILFCIMKLAT